jgi:hypothetical protein
MLQVKSDIAESEELDDLKLPCHIGEGTQYLISLTAYAYATLFLYQHFRLSILQRIYNIFHGAVSQC